MTRRDALARVSLMLGGTIIGSEIFLYGCKADTMQLSTVDFNENNILFLDEVGETIIPTSASSPGAKAAGIGDFMKTIVTDCYEAKDQEVFLAGIGQLNEAANEALGKDFMDLSAEDKTAFLTALDTKAKAYEASKSEDAPSHYFTMMKQLTLWGYFTSEVGASQALRYVETPGRWEACIPYEKGEKAWAI
ncbi:MAG: gluconate 2-dehydrogenase subunit 3 family protein [Saprospiraceae bacterium]